MNLKVLLRLLRRDPEGTRRMVYRLEDPAARMMHQVYRQIDQAAPQGKDVRAEISEKVLRVMFSLPQLILDTGLRCPMLHLPKDKDVLMTLALLRRRRVMETEAVIWLQAAQRRGLAFISLQPSELLRYCANAERNLWKYLNLAALYRLTVRSFGSGRRRLSRSERNHLRALRRKIRT
uniref:NS4 protein n=1 Tax=Baku virus TaxID=1484571 RepID=A0A3P8MIF0_9REOV|nr:NS4 protein [Baku virus]